jgi:phosphatidylserine synthase
MKTNRTLLIGIGMPCASLLLLILALCLWDYRLWVGIGVFLLISLIVGVLVRGMLMEQNLRVYRFDHQTETPLATTNEPTVLRPDMRENQYRQSYPSQPYYQPYQQ